MELLKLKKFLIKAKRATYAGNGKEVRLDDNSKELIYEEDSLKYRDRYFNSNPFFGEEVLFENNKIVWGMNYQGKTISDKVTPKEVYKFLKKALLAVPKEIPYRGPLEFQENNWLYKNKVEGTFEYFVGKEEIYYKDELVYILDYHGMKL